MEQSSLENLKRLKELLDAGVLTQEEFEHEKKKILDGEGANAQSQNTQPTLVSNLDIKKSFVTFITDCSLKDSAQQWFKSGYGKYAIYIGLLLALLLILIGGKSIGYVPLIAILMLGCATYKTEGIIPKIVLGIILLIAFFLRTSIVLPLILVAVFNLLCPKETSKNNRIIYSVLLLIFGNPLLCASLARGGIAKTIIFISSAIACSTIHLGMGGNFSWVKKIPLLIKSNRKILFGSLGVIALILLGIGAHSIVKDQAAKKAAHLAALEAARQDSIQKEELRIRRIEEARRDSIARIEQARQDSIDKIEHQAFVKKMAAIGLIIDDVSMARGTDKDGETTKGVEFSIFNPTNKEIKYVIANIVGVNSVGDIITYPKRCRGIGPVEPHDYGEWEFSDAFSDKNDVIDDLKVSFTVIYRDGSSKNVKVKDAYVDYKASWFE